MRRNQEPLRLKYPYLSAYSAYGSNPIMYKDIDRLKPTPYEAALMAKHAYTGAGELSGGWTNIALITDNETGIIYRDDNSGFKSQMYSRINEDGVIEYAYATAGTEEWVDWVNNATQPIALSEQYNQSFNTAIGLDEIFKNDELTFIGHSLGGGLATLNALATGREAITFNQASLSPLAAIKYGIFFPDDSNIKNYVMLGEIVDWLPGENYGQKHTLFSESMLVNLNSRLNPIAKVTNHLMDPIIDFMKGNPNYDYYQNEVNCED